VNNGSGKTIDAGAIVEIGFAQGSQKLNNGSGNDRQRFHCISVTSLTIFLMMRLYSIKTENISSTAAIIDMILVWICCHMAQLQLNWGNRRKKTSMKGTSEKPL
jgi:hypothetical protein